MLLSSVASLHRTSWHPTAPRRSTRHITAAHVGDGDANDSSSGDIRITDASLVEIASVGNADISQMELAEPAGSLDLTDQDIEDAVSVQPGAQKRLRALSVALQRLPRSATVDDLAQLMLGQNIVQHNMTTLLLTFKRRFKWRIAWLFAQWAERPDCAISLSTMHYNLLISTCARVEPERALDIFKRMKARRDVVTHNSAMVAALYSENAKRALEIFNEMDRYSIPSLDLTSSWPN